MDIKRTLLTICLLLLTAVRLVADDFTLKGKVVDEEGNAMELASVSCLEQAKLTMTNLKGEFNIKLHSADSVTVRFTMVGYKPRVRTFKRPRGTLTVQIVMSHLDALYRVMAFFAAGVLLMGAAFIYLKFWRNSNSNEKGEEK